MQKIKDILAFCSLLDRSGSLSLTNLSLVLLVGKILVIPSPDLAAVVPLILAFASYMHKRTVGAKAADAQVQKQVADNIAAQQAVLDDVNKKYSEVKDKLASFNLGKLVGK